MANSGAGFAPPGQSANKGALPGFQPGLGSSWASCRTSKAVSPRCPSGPARSTLAPLSGGISNLSFTATDDDRQIRRPHHPRLPVPPRLPRPRGDVGPRRPRRRLRAEVVHAEPGLMVSRFIEGKVLTAADVRADIPRIADLLRRFHRDMPAASPAPASCSGSSTSSATMSASCARAATPARARPTGCAINSELEAAQIAAADRVRPPRSAARQPHRRRQAALADRLRICRLRHRHVRPRQPQLEQRLLRRRSRTRCSTPISARAPDEPMLRSHAAMEARLAAARGAVVAGLRSAISTGPASTTPPTPHENFAQARRRARRLPRALRKAR